MDAQPLLPPPTTPQPSEDLAGPSGFPDTLPTVDPDESPQTSDGDGASGRPWCPARSDQPSEPDVSSDMLNQVDLLHPRLAEGVPVPKVAAYMASRLHKPLDKEVRSCLRAECQRPTLEGKVALTPEVDPKMATFLVKFIRDPKKGINHSWRVCQEKLLGMAGPLVKILDMAEDAKSSGTLISPETLTSWAQRAVIFLGNANAAISTERHRSLLIKIDPKLWELATSEAWPVAEGNLFGDPIVRELGKFVNTFNSLDKAQPSIKRIFTPRAFGAAGHGRGQSTSRPYN